mgnify:CR=1 FL=1
MDGHDVKRGEACPVEGGLKPGSVVRRTQDRNPIMGGEPNYEVTEGRCKSGRVYEPLLVGTPRAQGLSQDDEPRRLDELHRRARQLQKLTLELSRTEDRERKRLAEILHDDLQQVLAAARFHLGMLRTRLRGDAASEELADQVGALLREAIGKARSLSHELSPAVLYQGDLGEIFEWLARQFEAKHGLVVHVEIRGRIDPRSETIRAFLYKAGRELLFNVSKHAGVEEARLRLQRIHRCVWLTISDKGRGFDLRALGTTDGFGLLSIRERVELLGGRMKIRTSAGRGSTFLISVPDSESV